MLYNLLTNYSKPTLFKFFFNFLTVRTGLVIITAMIIVFLIGDKFINYFSTKKNYRSYSVRWTRKSFIKKIGTPTMGGVFNINRFIFRSIFMG